MSIQTSILTTTKENKYTYLAQSAASNSIDFLPGDGTLIIPDFDSYVMFDFSQQMPDGTLIETDLSGAGQIYLIFIDDQRQIKIPALQNMSNVNKSIGQVVFKVNSEQASTIFQLSTRTFFITTAISINSTLINETALYAGFWQKSNEPERTTFSQRIEILKNQDNSIEKRNKILKIENDILRNKKNSLSEKSIQLNNIIKDLKNQIGIISTKISTVETKKENSENKDIAVTSTATSMNTTATSTNTTATSTNNISSNTSDISKITVEKGKNKKRKVKIIEIKKSKSKKYSNFFTNLDPNGKTINSLNNTSYALEIEDTKERISIKRFAYIYSDSTTIRKNSFIDNSWLSIKDTEGGRPLPGKVTLLVLIDKKLNEFDAKEQFKVMIGTDPIKEPPFEYNDTNKSPAAYYLGGDNYYYKYEIYARNIDPNKKINEIIGEIEL